MNGRSLLHRINDRDEAEEFWRALQNDPVFIAGMAAAAEDHAQGRFKPVVHKNPRPVMTNAIAGPTTNPPRGVR